VQSKSVPTNPFSFEALLRLTFYIGTQGHRERDPVDFIDFLPHSDPVNLSTTKPFEKGYKQDGEEEVTCLFSLLGLGTPCQ
jgi:hypothetical protein